MNKSFEALLRGYFLFDVNGKLFLRYNSALAERKATSGNVQFNGLHIFKGWVCFFLRRETEPSPQPYVFTCKHCYGLGYDASGLRCTCSAEM